VETLALCTAREACGEEGTLVVFDRAEEFYPPAAARLGIELGRLVVVQAAGEADNLWALDQALRTPGVAAVLAWPEKLDAHSFRRLQLAAEAEAALGLLIRPEKVRHEPSWADVRLLVEPRPVPIPVSGPPPVSASGDGRLISIQLLRCRGRTGRGQVEVEIDHETHPLHPTSQLARRATLRRAAGA
jgi:protein ImuA